MLAGGVGGSLWLWGGELIPETPVLGGSLHPSRRTRVPTDFCLFLLPPQVILILTKYYHADAEKVLESSLWR